MTQKLIKEYNKWVISLHYKNNIAEIHKNGTQYFPKNVMVVDSVYSFELAVNENGAICYMDHTLFM